jgi:hypothetical protein
MSVTRIINKQNAKRSTSPKSAEAQAARAQASLLQTQARALAHLRLHRERLTVQYERTLKLLLELQKERRAKEESDRNA